MEREGLKKLIEQRKAGLRRIDGRVDEIFARVAELTDECRKLQKRGDAIAVEILRDERDLERMEASCEQKS